MQIIDIWFIKFFILINVAFRVSAGKAVWLFQRETSVLSNISSAVHKKLKHMKPVLL